jgi:hypothetical protein
MPKRRGRPSAAQTPAPNSDKISGSSKNKVGSATNKGSSKINLSNKTINSLKEKLENFKKDNPSKKNIDLNDLKAVYRRGSGAYSKSHRPTITGGAPNSRAAWSYARVNKFLKKASGEKVKAAYVQDDDLMAKGGLIAPNGNNSNLTLEQYKLVRTPEFKAWFGDWENDPANASKVVDENGEPKVVYHGTKKMFTEFKNYYQRKNKKLPTDRVPLHFFSSDKNHVIKYIGRSKKALILECFLSMKNPLDYGISDGVPEVAILEQNKDGFMMSEIFAVPNSSQIKLADGTNITFDAENPDIRYEDGGELGQEIVCKGCGWRWNTNQSDEHDKYICHKCWFDNRIYYDSDPIGYADGDIRSLPNIQFEKGGLIAPNGKQSNLTLEQYKLVRTAEFKAWFGDWENDPENASKVVDENGEPLVVYHGTNSEINEFMPYSIDYYYEYGEPKTEKIFRGDESITEFKNKSKERGWRFIEPNFWFSKNNAYTNTKKQYNCFLKIIHLKKQIDDIVIKRTEKELFIENFGVEIVWSEDTERYYCVFESNQIKLADGTNNTFDAENPDIRYADGGKTTELKVVLIEDGSLLENEAYDIVSNEIGATGMARLGLLENNKLVGAVYIEPPSEYDLNGVHTVEPLYEYKFDIFIKRNKRNKGYSKLLLDSMIKDYVENFDDNCDQIRAEVINEKLRKSLEKNYDFLCDSGNEENITYCYLQREDAKKLYNMKMKDPIKAAKGKKIEAKGDCYYIAGQFAMHKMFAPAQIDFIGEPYIVHAEVKGQGKIEGLRYGHAWIEDDENVYDYSNGRQIKMPKIIYYLIGDIRTDNPKKYMKYTFPEARKKMVDTGTYGSWDIDTLYEEGGGILYKEGGLIAPNGKKSNLTPEQYKLVRTPEFKAWFGDWENDPQNASKVVDQNGEPKVYYQGHPYSEYPQGKNLYEKDNNGIFFTSSKRNALTYGMVKSVFINSRNPKDIRNYYGYDNKKISAANRNDNKYYNKESDEIEYLNSDPNVIKFYEEVIDKYGKVLEIYDYYNDTFQEYKGKKEIKDFLIPTSQKGYKFLNFKFRSSIWDLIAKHIINSEYDGLLATDEDKLREEISDSVVVYNSNQVKIADGTNTTFDTENPDIRYGEGGLIAPNGKPSNLTAEQYKLVRTPEFKAWFGDWENDPQNASKVVDQNGEPKVVFHGTSGDWWKKYFVFNPAYEGEKHTVKRRMAKGIYFTSSIKVAKEYIDDTDGHIFSFFLNFRNPILFDMKGQDLNNLDLNSTDYNDDVIIKNTLDTRNNHDLEREQYISDIYLTSKTFGAIKLADGTNTKFDSNNPDVRYSDGGTTIEESDTNMQEVLKETESLKEISIKHGVTMQYLEEQLKIGSDHEKEHFKSEKEVDSEVLQKVAEVIALHHLAERPDYYEKLAELELEDGDIVSEENIPIEIIDFLASQKMEAEQVLMCSDSRLFKTMICRAKIDLSEQRCNDCENPEEKIAWNECKNIWQYCMNDILDNNIPSFKKGGTTCSCGTMYEKGGLAYGNSHDKGGIPLKVSSTGQNIEIEGGEGVVNKRSMQISKKLNFEGQKMTPCEVISKINQMGGGVKFKCSDVENIIAEDGNF